MRLLEPIRALVAAVAAAGGVARVTTLVREGHTRHRIAAALSDGLLERVRRDWVALPGADTYLVAAARNGVVLSCVTAARRIGLWVADRESQPHVAHPGRGRTRAIPAVTVHWNRAVVPRHPDALVDAVENILMTVAVCQPLEQARVIWESALNQKLIDLGALSRLPWTGVARSLLSEALPWSDSGLETLFRTRLRWLKVAIFSQTWIAGHRVDFLLGERLVVQIDGGHHVGAQRDADIAHDAALMLLGYHVIRVSYVQIIHHWPEVQDRIMRAVAQGLHLA